MKKLKVAAGLLAGTCLSISGQAVGQSAIQAPATPADAASAQPATVGVNQAPEPPTGGAQASQGSTSAGQSGTAGAQSGTTGDIIVTAQRRDESLSRTPVAVSVLSADALAKAQVVSERDLAISQPGLSVRASISSNQLNFALRGQSQDAFSGTRPGVLPYVNEVQISGGASTAFYDLQSIQVLKGPQGTLFGRSATGGAVLFTTAKPTDQFGGYASAAVGNYAARKFEGALNLPIASDNLMMRVAAFYQERDGFQRNLFDGNRIGGIQRTGVRGSLTANVGIVRNDLVVDYLRSRGGSTAPVISGLVPFTGGNGPPFVPIQFLYAGTATPVARATGIGTVTAFLPPAFAPLVPGFYDNYFANPKHPAGGINAVLAAQQANGPFKVNQDGENTFRGDNVIITNSTTFDVGDDTRIKNIFGFTHLRAALAQDADGTPYAISQNSNVGEGESLAIKTRQISEEIQLLGETFDSRLNYVAGVYYQDEYALTRQHSDFFDILLGGQEQLNVYKITSRTFAGYAQGTYKLNDDGLAATVGLRYTSEKAGRVTLPNDVYRVALGNPAPAGYSYDQSRTFGRLSWQIGLQDQVNSKLLIYGVSRRAYKSGGYNGLVAPLNASAASGGNEFNAERVTDVELGAKFNGELGDKPVRANIALYHNWVRNNQRTAFTFFNGSTAALTVNVPHARIYGAEVDAQIRLIDWLTVGGTFNYTHARFGADPVFVVGSSQIFNQVPDTPETSGSLFADVSAPVSNDLSLLLHADGSGQSKSFTAPRSLNNAGSVLGGYVIANFRVGVESRRLGLTLTANLKNAFDRVYYVGGLPVGEIYQINTLIPGEPRTISVEARIKF